MRAYKTARHPKTNAWHVVGHIGGGQYMEISGPFASKAHAEKWIPGQLKADSAAKNGTLNWKPDKLEISS
jgi:hypothetical protein